MEKIALDGKSDPLNAAVVDGLVDFKVSVARATACINPSDTLSFSVSLSLFYSLSLSPCCSLLRPLARRVAFEHNRSIIVRIRGAARHRTAANSAEVQKKGFKRSIVREMYRAEEPDPCDAVSRR